ncbi:MAG: replication restart helicase PriA [Alphaproteobacteria bacterium]
MQVQVLIANSISQLFSYDIEAEVHIGQVVFVPFRKKMQIGVIWKKNGIFCGELKQIEKITPWILNKEFMTFIDWVSNYTISKMGAILKMVIPFNIKDVEKVIDIPKSFFPYSFTPIKLNREQNTAFEIIKKKLGKFRVIVLDGVTGSGKTEVYGSVIAEVIDNKKQVLVLLPEIALTVQVLKRFKERFGIEPFLWHSSVSKKEKREVWQRILNKDPLIVVGARSALFLPFNNLGLIVVDEEHDASYKQEEQILYNARDMSVVRAKMENIPIVLSSATPSIETFTNVKSGKYDHIVLIEKYSISQPLTIKLADMKQLHGWISDTLKKAIEYNINKSEQTLLFVNRRGYAPFTICNVCGYRFHCSNCSTWLVQHQKSFLSCHHCGFTRSLSLNCPECKSNSLISLGIGVEKIEEEILKLFPTVRVTVITSDTYSSIEQINKIINSINKREIDIIIGTQVLAKGHHFPFLTLVGVIDADMGFYGTDLRTFEKTYQLLHQVSGRAGREDKKGTVILQTYQPNSTIIQALVNQDRELFYECELKERHKFNMPPYSRLVGIILSSLNETKGYKEVQKLANLVPNDEKITVWGPIKAPIYRLRNRYRWRFLIKSPKNTPIRTFLNKWLKNYKQPYFMKLMIDIDPQSFY